MNKMRQLAVGLVTALFVLAPSHAAAKGFWGTADVSYEEVSEETGTYVNEEYYNETTVNNCTGANSCNGGFACTGTSVQVATENSCNGGSGGGNGTQPA